MDVCKVCTDLLNEVSGENVSVEMDIATRFVEWKTNFNKKSKNNQKLKYTNYCY